MVTYRSNKHHPKTGFGDDVSYRNGYDCSLPTARLGRPNYTYIAYSMFPAAHANSISTLAFPGPSPELGAFGFKFSSGGTHISRTMMLQELAVVLADVPRGALPDEYRAAVIQQNILGKTTDSTRHKTLRHLRELYALDERVAIFKVLRTLYSMNKESLPLLAFQVAWARDPLLRSTSCQVMEATENELVETASLAKAVGAAFPNHYSAHSQSDIARNAGSSWTQSGHLAGRAKKKRRFVKPTVVAVTMALLLGQVAGYHGAAVFSNPWCRLLDLNADGAKSLGVEAHRAGLLHLRAIGEVIELSFPLFAEVQGFLQ